MEKVVVLGNSAGWCGRSWEDIKFVKNGKMINAHFPVKTRVIKNLVRMHYSERVNQIVHLPWKQIWFRYFVYSLCNERNTELVLIIYDGNKLGNDERFLKYLRKYYKNLKLIYIITNEVRYSIANRNHFFEKLDFYYDIIYGFHEPDGKKFGIDIIPLVYSKNNICHGKSGPCLFFAGEAKNRLKILKDVYYKIRELGFDANFFILHVNDNDITEEDGFTYNHPISYDDVLRYTQESAVLIEVPQDGLEAITIKTCEAVYYNKLLITTNPKIKEMPFYDPRYMLCIEDIREITADFLEHWDEVEYTPDAREYFSVNHFLERVHHDLYKKGDNRQGE